MTNEKIVARLRNVLQDGPYNFISEPLVASKLEHVFLISKDIPDYDDKITIKLILQLDKHIPQVVVTPLSKTVSAKECKNLTIDFVPFIVSITDEASYGELNDCISNLVYNVSDVLCDYTAVNDITNIEETIIMESKDLYSYSIILPKSKMGIMYNAIYDADDDKQSTYTVLSRFDRHIRQIKAVDSLGAAIATIKESLPKDISDCWWRLDITKVFTKLFDISEPKIFDRGSYVEYIGEFKSQLAPSEEYNCWLKVTKSNVTDKSKLYLECSSLSPYIHIKIYLEGYDEIVYKAYEIVNRVNAIINTLNTMTIGKDSDTLYKKLADTNGHIDIAYKDSNNLIITYWKNGNNINIVVRYEGYNRPKIVVCNNYGDYVEYDSVDKAILNVHKYYNATRIED